MKVLLTGGTGFIGGHLARALRERGAEVVALVRDAGRAARLRALGCTTVPASLADRAAVEASAAGCDLALHVAAMYEIGVTRARCRAMFEANVTGTETVLDACVAAGVTRIVYVSTVNVFGNTRGRMADETYQRDQAQGFLSCYDETKYLAHQAAVERSVRGAPVLIACPSVVYGPGDRSELGDQIARAARGKLPFVVFGGLGVMAAHVEDVVAGLLLVAERGRIGEAYILAGDKTTMRDLIGAAARAGGVRPPRLELPGWAVSAAAPLGPLLHRLAGMPPNLLEVRRASDGVTYWASDAKARAELGYTSRPLSEGMAQTVAALP